MNNLKKSFPLERPVSGNSVKYESYRESFRRIKDAQKSGFYLEAITNEESIISDRITSWLAANIAGTKMKNVPSTFNNIIEAWRVIWEEHRIGENEVADLINQVDKWRRCRNVLIHSFAKSQPGTATIPILTFLQLAEVIARQGQELTNKVRRWHKAEIRAAGIQNKTKSIHQPSNQQLDCEILRELLISIPTHKSTSK